MTDRQAKELTLSSAMRVQRVLTAISDQMKEIGSHFVFEPASPSTVERFRHEVSMMLDKIAPNVSITNVQVVHDSITFELDYDRPSGKTLFDCLAAPD